MLNQWGGTSLASFHTLGFEHSYSCRVAPASGATDGAPPKVIGCAEWNGDWLDVEFSSQAGQHWVGRFDGVAADYPLRGVYATPDPSVAIVANHGEGYLVNATDPGSAVRLAVLPVLDVKRVDGQPLVVVCDFQRIAAYGRDGLTWVNEHVVDDELSIVSADENGIRVEGRNAAQDRMVAITLDPANGAVKAIVAR